MRTLVPRFGEKAEAVTQDSALYRLDEPTVGSLGFARLQDLYDGTPIFDLRLAQMHRGRGWGTQALQSLTDVVFFESPEVNRFEGVTRADNVPMRRAFLRVGFVKEAHYRQAWPTQAGELLDSVAYAILRQDWEGGKTTPLNWEDMPS